MAARKKADTKTVDTLEKIANLLALLLTKESKGGDAIMQLSRSGFSDDEIAELLHTTTGTIRQTRYLANKKKPT